MRAWSPLSLLRRCPMFPVWRQKVNNSCLIVLCLLLTSCGGTGESLTAAFKKGMNFERAKVWIEKVSFKADDNMNDQSPVTVHLVVAYTPELLGELVKLDANSYFLKADQLKVDHNGKIDVFSFDILRGQRLNDQPINLSRMSGEGAIIFARYASPGPHRSVLSDESAVLIELNKDDFKVVPQKSQ